MTDEKKTLAEAVKKATEEHPDLEGVGVTDVMKVFTSLNEDRFNAELENLMTPTPAAADAMEKLGAGSSPLKDCPFCDAKELSLVLESEQVYEDRIEHFVRCGSCGAQGGWAKTEAGARHLWNMRPDDAS